MIQGSSDVLFLFFLVTSYFYSLITNQCSIHFLWLGDLFLFSACLHMKISPVQEEEVNIVIISAVILKR